LRSSDVLMICAFRLVTSFLLDGGEDARGT